MIDRLNNPVAFGERLIQHLGYQIHTDYVNSGIVTADEVAAAKVALFDRLVKPYMETRDGSAAALTPGDTK